MLEVGWVIGALAGSKARRKWKTDEIIRSAHPFDLF
jgi:hypothetical protein